MKILLLTPAPADSLAGNRVTADRWARLLRAAGHEVLVESGYNADQANQADLLLVLHAWRSRQAVRAWRAEQGDRPILLVLTGTDLYHYQYTHPEQTLPAMKQADGLIVLHDLAWQHVPASMRQKITIVRQSADAVERRPGASGFFDVCVIGHLRQEKDPLRAALASRLLPPASRVRILQAGRAHDDEWEAAALAEMSLNPRYQWLGELSQTSTRELMRTSKTLVISSVMEGGANVVSEACRAGLAVIASDIPGNRGLLGDHYPGLYPVGDEASLAGMLERAENDAGWLASLELVVAELAGRFTPDRERASLEAAIARVNPEG